MGIFVNHRHSDPSLLNHIQESEHQLSLEGQPHGPALSGRAVGLTVLAALLVFLLLLFRIGFLWAGLCALGVALLGCGAAWLIGRAEQKKAARWRAERAARRQAEAQAATEE